MLRQPVVPDGDRVGAPAEAAAEARLLHVLLQEAEQLRRLALAEPQDARGEEPVDEEALPAALWVRCAASLPSTAIASWKVVRVGGTGSTLDRSSSIAAL